MPQGFRCCGGLRLPDQVGARKFLSRHEERRRRGEALRGDTARPSHRGRGERGVCVEHGIPSPINNNIQFEPRINSSTYKYFVVVFLWSACFWQLAVSLNALLPSIERSTATAPNRHLTRSSAAGAGGGHGARPLQRARPVPREAGQGGQRKESHQRQPLDLLWTPLS